MLECQFHGGYFGTSLYYVVRCQKTYYAKKIGLGPFFGVPTSRFLGPTSRAGPQIFEFFKNVLT